MKFLLLQLALYQNLDLMTLILRLQISVQKKCGVEVQTTTSTVNASGESKTLKESLRELKEMLDEGLISEEDYEKKKDALLHDAE